MSSDVSDVSSRWFEALAWIETHKHSLMLAGAGLVVLVFVVAAYRWKAAETERTANEALFRVSAPGPSGAAEPVVPAGDYLKLAKDYAGTAAAERALLLGAGALYAEGKFAEAQGEFDRFLREDGASPLASNAAYGVAASLEAQGKKDEALSAYKNVQTRYPKSALVDETRLAMARIYEAKGQPELALRTYEEVARPGAAGGASSQASLRKQQLLAAHPELAKTNAPAASGTNAPVTLKNAGAAPAAATNPAPAKP